MAGNTLQKPPAGLSGYLQDYTRQSVLCVGKTILFADTSPVTLFKVPAACLAIAIGVRVTTAYDAAAFGESLEILQGSNILFKVNRPTLSQTSAVASTLLFQPLSAGTDITAALGRSNASVGVLDVWMLYRPYSSDFSPLEGIK